MKNIHLLPTDNSSRLGIYNGILTLHRQGWRNGTQHIYITSDEYIGLSYYLDGNLVRKGVVDDKDYWEVRKDYKKIILTTDQDLIKDGVQAIDDEFLEWLVKNQSCESVEVENKYYYNGSNNEIPYHISLENLGAWGYGKRKIIIPKEEVKEETQGYICPQTKKQCDDECCVSAEDCHIEASFDIISDCEPSKQETLEEFIQRQLSLGKYQDQESAIKYSIELGAKWQQERTCKHIYTLTSEQGHRVIKCSKCNDTQPI